MVDAFLLLTAISDGPLQDVIEQLTKSTADAYKYHRRCLFILNQHPTWVSDEIVAQHWIFLAATPVSLVWMAQYLSCLFPVKSSTTKVLWTGISPETANPKNKNGYQRWPKTKKSELYLERSSWNWHRREKWSTRNCGRRWQVEKPFERAQAMTGWWEGRVSRTKQQYRNR